MFYDLIPADIIQNFSQPFRYSYTYNTPFSLADPLRGQAPLLLTTNITNPQFIGLQSATYPDPGMRMPYVEQVNLSVQLEIVRDTVLEVAYVGKFGHKLLYGNESNRAVYRPGETLSNGEQLPHHSGLGQPGGDADLGQLRLYERSAGWRHSMRNTSSRCRG